jgi:hypothetical protein
LENIAMAGSLSDLFTQPPTQPPYSSDDYADLSPSSSLEDIGAALQAADAAGNVDDARILAHAYARKKAMQSAAPTGVSNVFKGQPQSSAAGVRDNYVGPFADQEVRATRPTLTERFNANAENSYGQGTSAGGLGNLLASHMAKAAEDQAFGPANGSSLQQIRDERNAQYALMPSWSTAPTLKDKIEEGAAALAGQVAGSIPTPESFISLPYKFVAPLARPVEKVLAPIIGKAAPRVAQKGVEQAVINTATDPAVQEANIAAGEQDQYDPVRTALAPALGALVGGSMQGAHEIAGSLADSFRAWRANRQNPKAAPAPDAAPTPQELSDFASSPEMMDFFNANGITDPNDPRIALLQEKLGARRQAEAERGAPQDAGGSKLSAFKKDQQNQLAQQEAVKIGEQNPATLPTAGRVKPEVPPVIPVDSKGQADIGDAGVRAGVELRGKNNALVPTERPIERMTPEEIARSQAKMFGGNENTAEPPPRFVAPEDRLPQTPDQVQQDRQSGQAFTLADQQRQRAASDVRDTQPAGRPEGVAAQQIVLDEGFPVQVLSRQHETVNGKTVEMATVRRYDPRTGAPEDGAVEYKVPVRQLTASNYSPEPRGAQDFSVRAEGPATPERPRMADQGVTREPRQTYRTTQPDPNEAFPAAGEGRSPLPEQPNGPSPFRQRPSTEEEVLRQFKARQEQARAEGAQASEGPRANDRNGSPVAKAPGPDGRFEVDDRGFVVSDKGGPITFADQKQAAKWIINKGHKLSPDQIFEIHNHPAGKGFTARERGRAETSAGAEASGEARSQHAGSSRAPNTQGIAHERGPHEARASNKASGSGQPARSSVGETFHEGNYRFTNRDSTATAPDELLKRLRALNVSNRILRVVDEITNLENPNVTVLGLNDPIRRIITISMQDPNMLGSLNHEIIHAFRDTNLFTSDEWSILERESAAKWVKKYGIENLYSHLGREEQLEEGVAFAFSDFARNADKMAGDSLPAVVRRAFARVRQVIRTIGSAIAGRGLTTAEDVFGRIDRGEVGARSVSARRHIADAGGEGAPSFGRRVREVRKEGLDRENAAAQQIKSDFENGKPDFNNVSETLSGVFGWVKKDAQSWAENARDMTRILPLKGDMKEQLRGLHDWLARAAYTNDGVLRMLAARHKSDTIREIADMFHAPAGPTDKAIGQTYHEAVNESYAKYMNGLKDLLSPLEKMRHEDREAALSQIGKLIVNPGSMRKGTPVHDAAIGIAKMLKDIHTYLRNAGVEVGEVKSGYLPRIENVEKILQNPEEFQRAATKAFIADGAMSGDARKAAEEWFQRLLLGDLGVHSSHNDFFAVGNGNVKPNFTRGRTLSKKADTILGDFYLRNPADIMPSYIMRATKRAEWARRMGDDLSKWATLKEKMISEGAGEAIPEIVQALKSATGNFGAATGRTRGIISFMRTWSTFSYLSRATFSSLSEPVTIGIRTGSPIEILRAYSNTVQQWVPALRKLGNGEYAKALAEDFGFVGDAIDQIIMLQRVGGTDTGAASRKLQSQFFRHIGLQQFTEANRIAAMHAGTRFLRRLANDVAESSPYADTSKKLLAELGVDTAHAEKFSKWVIARDGSPHLSDILEGGENGRAYHTALGRFIAQTVMHPTGSIRPRYAQHPLGSLLYNLMSFNFAFQKNVLNRVGKMTVEALNPKSGLNWHERARYLAPLSMLPVIVGVQYALNELRDAALTDTSRPNNNNKDEWSKFMTALSRGGLTGAMDPILNGIYSLRYQRDPATTLAGPAFGLPLALFKSAADLAGNQNSPNTNTQERKFARDIYNFVIEPALIAGITGLSPVNGSGLLVGALGIQTAAHPATREAAVKALVGGSETQPRTAGEWNDGEAGWVDSMP